jgi:hypothetical protein
MTDQSIEDASRKDFEAWALWMGFDVTINEHTGTYSGNTFDAWTGWQAKASRQSSQSEPVATAWKFRTRFKLDGDWFKWGNCNLTGSWEIVQGLLDYAEQKQDYQVEYVSFVESHLAAPQQAIPSGWRLVPIEPTVGMKDAGEWRIRNLHSAESVYKGMLSACIASPTAPIESDK